MIINLDTIVPDFSDYDSDKLPLKKLLFKRDRLFESDKACKSFLVEGEDKDKFGN